MRFVLARGWSDDRGHLLAEGYHGMVRFEPVAKLGDVNDGELALFEIAGSPITIANVGGTFYGFHDVCTHMGCSLAAGCPTGQWSLAPVTAANSTSPLVACKGGRQSILSPHIP